MSDLTYPEQYRVLLANTENHELQILHEDGLYRHLRFAEPGTGIWHWDLITWPGSLHAPPAHLLHHQRGPRVARESRRA